MRILIRVVLWPVRLVLSLLAWIVLFVTHFVGIGCYMMAGGCVILAVDGWLMGLVLVEETVKTLGIGFVFFIGPTIGVKLITGIGSIEQRIRGLF